MMRKTGLYAQSPALVLSSSQPGVPAVRAAAAATVAVTVVVALTE